MEMTGRGRGTCTIPASVSRAGLSAAPERALSAGLGPSSPGAQLFPLSPEVILWRKPSSLLSLEGSLCGLPGSHNRAVLTEIVHFCLLGLSCF